MDAIAHVDPSLVGARVINVFILSFFYIFAIAKLIGPENKANWFRRRMKYTFFTFGALFVVFT